MAEAPSKPNPMLRVVSLRDFRLLFSGTTLSLLGDQFALIATPWLVLQLTGDPMVLGIVLALEGLPRAAFMLIGGAVTDRLSPRRIMLIADTIRMVLTGLMALVVLTGTVEIWMLYVFSLGFGTGGRICRAGREQHRTDGGEQGRSAGRQFPHHGRDPARRLRRPLARRHRHRRLCSFAFRRRLCLHHRCRQLRCIGIVPLPDQERPPNR